ncbi:hypothetical protein ACJJTC_000403 [Scirpophaga incertulas]
MLEVSTKTEVVNLGITFPSMDLCEVSKESIGLCRCCLAEGLFKDMAFEYIWMNDNEVYADMLLETLDISITLHTESLNGLKRLICETCICRLREASNFKKQVLDSEKQFLNMLRKGKLKPSWQNTQLNIKLEAADDADIDDDTYLEDLHFSVGFSVGLGYLQSKHRNMIAD